MTTPSIPPGPLLPPGEDGEGIDRSIVIPAYNEEARIVSTLQSVASYLARKAIRAEVVVVDDGSTDSTVARAEEQGPSVPRLRIVRNGRNRGKGFSVRHGFAESRGGLILLSDADLSTPIEEIEKLLPALREGYGIAIGSRGLDSSRVEVPQSWLRRNLGRVFNRIVRALTELPLRDTQCGFKLARRETLLPIFRMARVDRFAYDVEILYLAHRRRIRIAEIPVVWRNSPRSRVSILRDPLQMLWDVARIVIRERAGSSGDSP